MRHRKAQARTAKLLKVEEEEKVISIGKNFSESISGMENSKLPEDPGVASLTIHVSRLIPIKKQSREKK
jgi:hypothetical protein